MLAQLYKQKFTFITSIKQPSTDSQEVTNTVSRMNMLPNTVGYLLDLRQSIGIILVLYGLLKLYFFYDIVNERICKFLILRFHIILLGWLFRCISNIHFLLYNLYLSQLIYIMMNLLAKTSRVIYKSLLTKPHRSLYAFSTNSSIDFDVLASSFLKKPDMTIFSDLVRTSNNIVDNIYYFKIFKFLEDNKSDVKHYEDFFLMMFATVTRRSDNIRMLLAKIKARIAKKYEQNSQYQEAISHLQQGLEVLEQSLVPPIMLYYQMYRYFGLIHYKLNHLKEAQQILKQSVTTIQKCIEHSDDFVATNDNSKMQAIAQTILAELDTQNDQQWIKKAGQSWDEVDTDKTKSKEYCEYVIVKTKVLNKKDKERAQQFLTVSVYNVKDPSLKEYLKNKKSQLLK